MWISLETVSFVIVLESYRSREIKWRIPSTNFYLRSIFYIFSRKKFSPISQKEDIPTGDKFLIADEDSKFLLLKSTPPKFY